MHGPERRSSFRRVGRVALAAMLTTVVGYAGLVVVAFRALRELGALTSGVVVLVSLTYALAWSGLAALTSVRARASRRKRTPALIDTLLDGAPWVFWSGILLAFALVVNAGQLRFHEVPRGAELALLMLGPLLWLALGSARLALLVGAPPLLALAMTLGAMPLLGLDLDHLNVIVLPALLGMGVHGGARLLVQVDGGRPLRSVTWLNGLAVSGSLACTALGFALLLIAKHPGLRSITQLALLGLSLNLLVTVVLLPAMLGLFPSARGVARIPPTSGVVGHVATCFGAGRAHRAPGSLGALLALPAAWLMRELDGTGRLLLIAGLTLASTLAVHRYLAGRVRDPQEVVVDEWIGCLITLAFVPFSAGWVVAGYLLFRMFDILKPGPIRWLDRRVHGGVGVMVDDVAAGLAAGVVLALARLAVPG